MNSVVVDWIVSKRAKTLTVSNDRESFLLKKLTQSLETMKSINDNFLRQEERKIKQNLAKLTDISTSGLYSNIYKKPSSVMLLETQCDDMEPDSAKASAETSATICSDHLLKFFSFLQQPVRRLSNTDTKKSKDYLPFSCMDLNIGRNTPRPPHGLKLTNSNMLKCSNFYRGVSPSQWLSQELSCISIPESNTLFPPLHKLSGEKFPHHPVSGNLAVERRLRDLLLKTWQEEKFKRITSFSYIQPDDVLRCRYLRLSESNIATLLKRCEDSGIHVDIHPHMKESDIDFNTIMSSEKINTVSL